MIALIVSCDNMDDTHKKYADESKRVYLGRPDSVRAFPGFGSVKLTWYINADPKVETTVIYWNNRRDSIVKPFIRTQDGAQKDSVVIDKTMDGKPLAEGTYFFELVNKNSRGERSLPTIVQAKVYGQPLANSLKVRPVIDCAKRRSDEVVPRPVYDDRFNLSGYSGRGATSSQRGWATSSQHGCVISSQRAKNMIVQSV